MAGLTHTRTRWRAALLALAAGGTGDARQLPAPDGLSRVHPRTPRGDPDLEGV